LRAAVSLAAVLSVLALVPAAPAQAATVHLKDRFGHSVRVPGHVVAKLRAKHNVDLQAEAVWLPRSSVAEAEGTRRLYRIGLVRVRCRSFPIAGRVCWPTAERVTLQSVVDYRTNSQRLQQGLITAYCLGMDRCPGWVNRPSPGVRGGGAGGGGGGGW
jgi:hypothetical protein